MIQKNNMYSSNEELNCKHCGTDLLQKISTSIVVINQIDNKVQNVFACCKGECDRRLGSLMGWKDLKDFTNPFLYLKHIMAVLNNIHEDKMTFTDEALEGYKQILIKTAPYVFRNMSEEEKEQVLTDNMVPF